MASRPGAMKVFVYYWLPVLLYITLIVTLSAQPRLAPPFRFQNGDKLAHILEYFVLGWLMVRAMRHTFFVRNVLAAAVLAIVVGVGIGAGDEYFQSFIPGRDSNLRDLFADFVGLSLAQLTYLVFTREP